MPLFFQALRWRPLWCRSGRGFIWSRLEKGHRVSVRAGFWIESMHRWVGLSPKMTYVCIYVIMVQPYKNIWHSLGVWRGLQTCHWRTVCSSSRGIILLSLPGWCLWQDAGGGLFNHRSILVVLFANCKEDKEEIGQFLCRSGVVDTTKRTENKSNIVWSDY